MLPTAKTLNKTDNVNVHIGVTEQSRKEVCIKLSHLLASTYLLYLKTLYYHWNVTGPHFVGLHGLFEEQYQALHAAGDELAERIRALGHFTPGTVAEFLATSSVKDDKELPASSQQMVQNLSFANEACSMEAREVLEVAQNLGDDATADIAVDRMKYHDKTAWMLRAILE